MAPFSGKGAPKALGIVTALAGILLVVAMGSAYVQFHGVPAWASRGTYAYAYNEAKQAGVQFVYVGPEFNPTAAHFHAKWIRVRPGTDTAFLLAVADALAAFVEADRSRE